MRIERAGDSLIVHCPAKVNLFLEVLGTRPDGYHEIETVMQAISLYDTLQLQPAHELSLEVQPPVVSAGEDNLVMRAAALLRQHTGTGAGARMGLAKRIPVGGGLGGGSSDAAGTLVGLVRLWGLSVPLDELHALAAQLGSDVPFFLYGGTALCKGRGELVTPLPWTLDVYYTLVSPDISISTQEMYHALDRHLTGEAVCCRIALDSGRRLGIDALASAMHNAFERIAYQLYPSLSGIKHALLEAGAKAAMLSGSGATVYGVCASRAEAHRVAERVKAHGRVIVAEPESVSAQPTRR